MAKCSHKAPYPLSLKIFDRFLFPALVIRHLEFKDGVVHIVSLE